MVPVCPHASDTTRAIDPRPPATRPPRGRVAILTALLLALLLLPIVLEFATASALTRQGERSHASERATVRSVEKVDR